MVMLDGLVYRPNGQTHNLPETRAGVPQYGGSAADFPEWKFRVLAKVQALGATKIEDREYKRSELVLRVIDSLTDDALRLAMEMGMEELAAESGLENLVQRVEEHVSQHKIDEARDLFHLGTKPDGPLARQQGESITSYIARRKRWLQRLTALDDTTRVSENIFTGPG